jgi:hypothetical protein
MARRKAGAVTSAEESRYLICRDTTFGHDWKKLTARRAGKAFVRVLQCRNCGNQKEQHIDSRGFIAKSKPIYVNKNYLRPPGSGRMTAADNAEVRLTNLLNTLD